MAWSGRGTLPGNNTHFPLSKPTQPIHSDTLESFPVEECRVGVLINVLGRTHTRSV
ncbi:hypothetical protein DPEC_G00274090 [Dallia pectoralis]|uniref:Uncharacterized protein n=1 Tax=Dallia pectoralis TaxID=75939 RepID=A0ACC2FKV3_DALPE|nr:hypothetical protein DPEC_G00274090 [Dallia pectoralis]